MKKQNPVPTLDMTKVSRLTYPFSIINRKYQGKEELFVHCFEFHPARKISPVILKHLIYFLGF